MCVKYVIVHVIMVSTWLMDNAKNVTNIVPKIGQEKEISVNIAKTNVMKAGKIVDIIVKNHANFHVLGILSYILMIMVIKYVRNVNWFVKTHHMISETENVEFIKKSNFIIKLKNRSLNMKPGKNVKKSR